MIIKPVWLERVSTSHDLKLNFITIPKSGSTLLGKLYAKRDMEKAEPNTESYENEYIDNDYLTIAITRHPFDRCRSAYQYFYLRKEVNNGPERFGVECNSFDDFVKKIIMPTMGRDHSFDEQKLDIHIAAQTRFIAPRGKVVTHKRVDIEEVNSCEWLKKLFGVDKIPVVNNSGFDRFDEWTMELKELVTIRYMQDFYLLGYEPK